MGTTGFTLGLGIIKKMETSIMGLWGLVFRGLGILAFTWADMAKKVQGPCIVFFAHAYAW